jgi:iron complex outermembrane receptor protein
MAPIWLKKATFYTQWVVEEKVHNFYIQANIDGDLGTVPVRGNIGLRYADTEQSSTGTIGGGLTNTVGTSYGNWLPSMNLSFEIMPDTFIRIAAAKTITRSRLDQMTANQNIGRGLGIVFARQQRRHGGIGQQRDEPQDGI